MTETVTEVWGIRFDGSDFVLGCDDRYQAERKLDGMGERPPASVVVRTVTTTVSDWEDVPRCPYTHSHTRHWCGYKHCRES